MKLSSVVELKRELLRLPRALVETVAAVRSYRSFSEPRGMARDAMNDIALGIVEAGSREYRLAIRAQSKGPLVDAMVEQIADRARGEVDTRFVGRIVKLQGPAHFRARTRPLQIGCSISDVHSSFNSAGTLGCFVVERSSDRYLGLLTNNHVIANENGNRRGVPIVQPGTLDDGADPADRVGELGPFVRLRAGRANLVDAAYAYLYVDYDPRPIGTLGNLRGTRDVANLPVKATVHKVGRTTGRTSGRMTAFSLDNVVVQYDMGLLRFDDQIEIEGKGRRAFSDSGDSGSLIVDDGMRAIGLLFAGGNTGGTNGMGLTYANPIQTVLDALKVDLYR